MSKTEDTNKTGESQPKKTVKSNVTEIDRTPALGLELLESPDHNFDVVRIKDFISLVFQDSVPPGAHRLVYSTSNSSFGPGLPISAGVDHLTDKTLRSKKGKALYFNIASCYPDHEGVLRHKRNLFAALHVLVLDDIGTKIPLEMLPADLEPTYIIESSEGNYQYGYVLEQPVDNIDHATALVQTISLAGLTDKGGVMATKIVRLPDGINGKKDPYKRIFKVNLTKDDGPYWTPKAFLDCLNFEVEGDKVTWDSILKSEISPLAKKHRSEYLPLKPIAQTADGIIDPVLEWLFTNDMVVGDSGREWVDIECPWGHQHTTGSTTAGYSPLGRGEGKESAMRAFHCFHESCADNTTSSFIEHVLYNSDLRAIPVFDPTGTLFNNYVFDSTNNRVWRCGHGSTLAMNMEGFKTEYNNHTSALVIGTKGKVERRNITAANLWLTSPYRVVVAGGMHDPAGGSLIEDETDQLWVNTFRPVRWGSGEFDMAHVDKFKKHIDYLLPDEEQRVYFMDWLAAKVQDPYFRGTGIVMVAESFGVGRTTLGNMLSELFGLQNSVNVAFDTLLNPNEYNHWEDKQLIVVSEAKETAAISESRGAYRAYEALKQRVDTTVTETTLNIKFQPHRRVKVVSSYLILTNHTNAVAVPANDRRLTILRNPDMPAPQAYFNELNQWIGERDEHRRPVWAKHIWRWLADYEVSDHDALMHPLHTESKTQMTEQGLHGPGKVIKELASLAANSGMYYVGSNHLAQLVRAVLFNVGDPKADEYKENFMRNCLNDESISYPNWKVRTGVQKEVQRVRLFKQPLMAGKLSESAKSFDKYGKNSDVPTDLADKARLDMANLTEKHNEIVKKLTERLKENW